MAEELVRSYTSETMPKTHYRITAVEISDFQPGLQCPQSLDAFVSPELCPLHCHLRNQSYCHHICQTTSHKTSPSECLYLSMTPLYLKWILNKDLLQSTWNSAQCCLVRRGAWRRMNTYIYIWLNPFAVHLSNIINQYKIKSLKKKIGLNLLVLGTEMADGQIYFSYFH